MLTCKAGASSSSSISRPPNACITPTFHFHPSADLYAQFIPASGFILCFIDIHALIAENLSPSCAFYISE